MGLVFGDIHSLSGRKINPNVNMLHELVIKKTVKCCVQDTNPSYPIWLYLYSSRLKHFARQPENAQEDLRERRRIKKFSLT